MATILLQAAGAFLGGMLGPVGSAIGSAAGALAGYAIDSALINSTRRIEGTRLSGARPFTAEEGASIPRVYGTLRVGGTLIWATRFEETRTTKRQGGKGGPRVTEYAYFANAAFAVCEGQIAGIRRIWADGREIDRNDVEIRVYRGTRDQPVDPLIAAKQGQENAPAYRGLAYVVFDHLPIAEYGNRLPQIQFEVLRPVGSLLEQVHAICLIPGATEYGLSPSLVTRESRPGETSAENRHMLHAATDLAASLDEIQALCPNLKHVGLVATWFGDDLRAGSCRIRPGVATGLTDGWSEAWSASGVDRNGAMLLSTYGGGAAYGGTPSDRSIIAAIREIKARGLKVTLYPFIMMDIAGANGLPDPYGAAEQTPYPWRGRITCHPAPSRPGSVDRTHAARSQVQSFCGAAGAGDFSVSADGVGFRGTAGDWGYRRLILHFAYLAKEAGGVDAFLLGSELRGLTTLRDGNDAFPFVEKLCELAADARSILGPNTAISYGADWSEYFGHHPADGSGDVYFHLDALWSHPDVDAVGIDNYMPLSDWRDGDHTNPNPDGFAGPYDPEGLRKSVTGGEGYDWYYPSLEARALRLRAPITDGVYGKPWVFRYKDLAGWWANAHFNRIGGVEATQPTEWLPQSKPIWFTELGCPSVDKGSNQPNVFPDPKSAENAVPYFSDGGRSDIAQHRLLEAHVQVWNPASLEFDAAKNPVSPLYGGRMVDHTRSYLWAWDARPFPSFPLQGNVWADGPNWQCGHWLNGRLEAPELGALINAILSDHGLPPAVVDGVEGKVHGYLVADASSARSALEPLIELFDLSVQEEADQLVFRRSGSGAAVPVELNELVCEDQEAVIEKLRTPDHQLPVEAVLAFRDPLAEYQTVSVRNRRFGAAGSRQQVISFPGALDPGQARALLDDWMRRIWSERESADFSVPALHLDMVPGAILRVPAVASDGVFLVTQIEDGLVRRVSARQIARALPSAWRPSGTVSVPPRIPVVGRPYAQFLDLPSMSQEPAETRFKVALWQKPWRSQALFVSPESSGFMQRGTISKAATIGRLIEALPPGFAGRIDRSQQLVVELFDGEVESVSMIQLLNGANVAAVRSELGSWELIQFQFAEEIAPNIWRLGGLLRGQLGTDDGMAAGASAGASLVLLDDAVQPAGLLANEIGLPLNWRAGPAGSDFSGENFVTLTETGGLRARLPLSPVHLRARRRANGDVAFSWIRRGRIDADNWEAGEIPLGEETEQYRVTVFAVSGESLRTQTVPQPGWIYEAAAIQSDLGSTVTEIEIAVSQHSLSAGWGVAARRRILLG
jgi:hypothetical protein